LAPIGTLFGARDGNYYGTTSSGGNGRSGTAYRVTPSAITTLVSFNAPTPLAPVITSQLAVFGQQPQPGSTEPKFNYQITATNAPILFSTSQLPNGLTLDSATGLISGSPGVSGRFFILITAANAGGSDTKTLDLTIRPPAPVITSSKDDITVTVGDEFRYQITANNSPTTFNAAGLPPGVILDRDKGLLEGRPSAEGDYDIIISASNAGGTGSATIRLSVLPLPPEITSALAATAFVGEFYAYQLIATNNPTTFEARGLPPDVGPNGLRSAESVFSGTPRVAGTFRVTLLAYNKGGTGAATLVLTVKPPPPPAPEITSPPSASAQQNRPFSYQITARTVQPASRRVRCPRA
jgi:hypothetical protein